MISFAPLRQRAISSKSTRNPPSAVAHRLDDDLYALTGSPWRHNFRGGADVEVTVDGRLPLVTLCGG
jgi:hypothetical protein